MDVRDIALSRHFEYGKMTIGECIEVASEAALSVGEVIVQEAMYSTGKNRKEIEGSVNSAFCHNLRAAQIGLEDGESFLFGQVGRDLITGGAEGKVVDDDFVNRIVVYTLAAQVGNHTIGLQPCAGTGDSCPYTGFVKALKEDYSEPDLIGRVIAVILKVGGVFRVGKSTTGCNMEGFGAGAAALAGAFVELEGGTPQQMEKAIVLAISPTIAVPCTPRVLVPGLCATHIGGAVLVARLASRLATNTSLPSTVPVDLMIAMAAKCHLASAKHVVPITIQYMEPFYKHSDTVDNYVESAVVLSEQERKERIIEQAVEESRNLARKASPITIPFGDAVVGGSSQGVGSPTNCARLAHFLSRGEIIKVKIELYPELFARRAINVPGILMGAIEGAATDDHIAYHEIMEKVKKKGVDVEILEVQEPSLQRVSIEATEQNSMVDSLNRGGARLLLRDAYPDRNRALELAKELNIVVVDY